MLTIPVKERETLERALKTYKRKCDRIKVLKELRRRRFHAKPSMKRRKEVIKAICTERYRREHDLI